MDSVMPSLSGVSVSAAGGGMNLYSFFRILSLKNWFSLKCCVERDKSVLLQCQWHGQSTYEFDREASVFIGVLLDPQILEVAQRSLVSVVLSMVVEQAVSHQGDRPEVGNGLHNVPALFVDRLEGSLRLTL